MRVRGQSPILWRCLGQSQVGAEPGHAVVVDGLSPQEQQLLDRLPTSLSPSDVYQVARWSESLAPANSCPSLTRPAS